MPEPMPMRFFPVTNATVYEYYEYLFAPWVKDLGLRDLSVSENKASALLPQKDALKFSSGAICGQVIMAAVDTVISLAMATTGKVSRGTVYQHTHFLRPALNDDFEIQATVLRFGRTTAYAEARVIFVSSGALVAHATAEFAF
jgi:acyl-coenzyme A thioesterase PaaI-like protein